MMNLMMRLWKDEEGQGMVEYGLIIVFIALVVIVGLTATGNSLQNLFNNIAETIGE